MTNDGKMFLIQLGANWLYYQLCHERFTVKLIIIQIWLITSRGSSVHMAAMLKFFSLCFTLILIFL